jgi:hypothetical protein
MSAASRCLDRQHVSGVEPALRLGRQRRAVEQVAPDRPVLASVASARRVAAALGDQGEAHRLAGLELADDTVAAVVATRAAAAAARSRRPVRSCFRLRRGSAAWSTAFARWKIG